MAFLLRIFIRMRIVVLNVDEFAIEYLHSRSIYRRVGRNSLRLEWKEAIFALFLLSRCKKIWTHYRLGNTCLL